MRRTFATILALAVLGAAPAAADITCSPGPLVDGRHQNAPPGTLVSRPIDDIFKSDGANPRDLGTDARLTGVEWSTTDYAAPGQAIGVVEGVADRLFYRNKTGDELNRMADPPPSPFFVTATVSMENDEGETVTGCEYVFGTGYHRDPDEPEEPETPEPPTPKPTVFDPNDPNTWHLVKRPAQRLFETNAPPGVTSTIFPEFLFDNPGRNLRFTSVRFDTQGPFNIDRTQWSESLLEVTALTAEQLEEQFGELRQIKVKATITVQNDLGLNGTAVLTYNVEW